MSDPHPADDALARLRAAAKAALAAFYAGDYKAMTNAMILLQTELER